MNRHATVSSITILFLTIFFFSMATAAAQNQKPNENTDQDQVQSQQQPQNQDQNQSQAATRNQPRYRPDRDLLGDAVLGMAVRTKNGEEVGEIEDVTFGRNGKIERFIIDTGGGFLGMGGKTVSIHRSDLDYEADQDYAVYQGTEQDLEDLPDINYNYYAYGGRGYGYGYANRYPYWGPGYADPEARGYYGEPGYGPRWQAPGAGGRMPMMEQQRQEGQTDQQGQDNAQMDQNAQKSMQNQDMRGYHPQEQAGMSSLSINNIIGVQVRTQSGNNVGDIENLVVDPRGRIRSAVIDVGGFLGIGSKKVAVPFKELRNIGPYYVMYPGTEQELKNQPEFSGDQS